MYVRAWLVSVCIRVASVVCWGTYSASLMRRFRAGGMRGLRPESVGFTCENAGQGRLPGGRTCPALVVGLLWLSLTFWDAVILVVRALVSLAVLGSGCLRVLWLASGARLVVIGLRAGQQREGRQDVW